MPSLPEPLPALGTLPARLHAIGFTAWKRPYLRLCFAPAELVHARTPAQVPAGADAVLWGAQHRGAELAHCRSVLRVEDGFLRSVGLGADLVRPLSWLIDSRGLHYDPAQASDLELLLCRPAAPALLARAARLREAIVAARLSKYNVGAQRWQRPAAARKLLVVAGQVPSDAAVALGAPGVCSNLALLRAVREAEPGAYIVYKIHPDLAARLRAADADESESARWCDEVVSDVPMADLLDAAPEMHVMSSLAGFEALLRGCRVVCHGQPFYAGWGLTEDRVPLPRRRNLGIRLTLDELVAGALIRYPRYFSRDARRRLSPEEAVEALIHWRERQGSDLPWWRHGMRAVLRRTVGMR
jgi:capsular polysaccharide export protein